MVDHGRGQRGHGAGTRDDEPIAGARQSVDLADAGDEIARIGEVDVVRTRVDGSFCDAIVATLKRPASMDNEVGRQCDETRRQIACIDVDGRALQACRPLAPQRVGHARRCGCVAAGDNQVHTRVTCQFARDQFAEIPVSAEQEYAHAAL